MPRWDTTGALSRGPSALPVQRHVPIARGIVLAFIEAGVLVMISSWNTKGLEKSAEEPAADLARIIRG